MVVPTGTYWRKGIVESHAADPVVSALFQISRTESIATAGSCFAQHISRTLLESGFNYSVYETFDSRGVASYENYGVFSARFGNAYTVRQLVQLFDRAYGEFSPVDEAWVDRDGHIVDPLRPRIQKSGFDSRESLAADRARHLQKGCRLSPARAFCEPQSIIRRHADIAYFPSFEIITGPQSRGKFYGPDMREVNSEGVAFVMALFRKHYLENSIADPSASASLINEDMERMNEIAGIICDGGAVLK